MNEQMINKNNMKLFPIYKMFAWDLLFYYTMIFLFLTQVKGFSTSQVLLIDSFYAIFRIVFQVFCINIVDYIGKKNSLLLGNIFVSISILILILGKSFSLLIVLNLIQAIGYNLKSICEPTLLSDSIPKSSYSSNIYSKIDGKGSSFYYVFDATSSIIAGFLYLINPYISMVLCFICCLTTTIISLAFNNPIENKLKTSPGFIAYYKDTFNFLRLIIKSNRLKSLFLFSFFFWGLLSMWGTLRSSILVYVNLPVQYFGIITATMQMISSISARNQQFFHNKFHNRVLTWFSLSIVLSFLITGLLVALNINYSLSIISVFITIVIVGIVKGPYHTLIQRYFNNFSNPYVNTKIFATKSLVENISRAIVTLFTSFLFSLATVPYVFISIGCIFFVIFVFLLNYMKPRVGLAPNDYSKDDLMFSK